MSMSKEYKDNMVKYLEYLNENIKRSHTYSEYLKNMMDKKEVEFDEENGSQIQNHCDELGRSVEDMIKATEKIAQELDRLYTKPVKLDTRINIVLKSKEEK